MKRILNLLALGFSLCASAVFAATVEDWSALTPSNTGTYADTASKIEFEAVDGPNGGKALQITSTQGQGGYCGIWHNLPSEDLSKAGALKFQAKSTVAGQAQMTVMDAFNVQYVANYQVGTSWAEVTVPFSSFKKDSTYTPPGAIPGHPMDLSKTSGMNFSPKMGGDTVLSIGSVEAVQGGPAPAVAAAPTGPGLAKPIILQNFSDFDMKSGGTYQDSQGSTITFGLVDNKKKGKMLTVTYSLKGDYCGMWCRAGGSDWSGVKTPGANTLCVEVYCKQPLTLNIAVKDNKNNQYTADAAPTQGGKWETVCIPFSDFVLDPSYTPPDAVKGAPKDFSLIKQFNLQPKTKGDKITFAVDKVTAK